MIVKALIGFDLVNEIESEKYYAQAYGIEINISTPQITANYQYLNAQIFAERQIKGH